MQQFEAKVTLNLKTPFLFPGTDAGLMGYDRVSLRNSNGDLIVPQDQLRGLMRHGLCELGRAETADILFGYSSDRDLSTPYDPKPGLVYLSDLVCQDQEPDRAAPYFRVSIDEESGAAEEGHLIVIEQPFPPQKTVSFGGRLILYASDKKAADKMCQDMALALSVWDAIGSHTSIGFGQLSERPSVSPSPETKLNAPVDVKPSLLRWSFTLDRPYLVDSSRPDGNTFLGSADIPGGALKGVLARVLARRALDIRSDALTALRIGFATSDQSRLIPLSMVKNSGQGVDVSREEIIDFAPVPQVDWKTGLEDYTSEQVKREERVHTAIDDGAAKDNALFSEVSVIPRGKTFTADLDISALGENERASLKTVLQNPMPGLGRTNATIETTSVRGSDVEIQTISAGKTAVIVKTKGLLADFSDGTSLFDAYTAFWKNQLPNSELIRCFAEQIVVGAYFSRRFGPEPSQYRPWVLTKAGSIFVFDLAIQDVTAFERLLSSGVCRETLDGVPMNWCNCPFVATNGYGSIAIHQTQEG